MLTITSHLDAWRRLAGARWGLDLSERDLATAIGGRPEIVARLRDVSGESLVSFDSLHRVCAYLGVPTGALLVLHDQEHPPPPPTNLSLIWWARPPAPEQIAQVQFANRLPEILTAQPVSAIAARGSTYRPRVIAQRHGAVRVKARILAAICEQTGRTIDEVFPISFPGGGAPDDPVPL